MRSSTKGERQHDEAEHQIDQVEIGPEQAFQRLRNARDAVGAAGEPDLVLGHDADHLGEAEGHDGEVVVAQAGEAERDQPRPCGGHQHGGHEAEHDRHVPVHGEQRRDVGAEREEADDAEIDHPGHAPHHVEAKRQDA